MTKKFTRQKELTIFCMTLLSNFGRPYSTLKRKCTLKYKMDEMYEIVQKKAKRK